MSSDNSTSSYRTGTNTPLVVGAGIACLISALLMWQIDVSTMMEVFSYEKKTDARVPAFSVRVTFLIIALVAAFIAIINTNIYKRNKIAYSPWIFLSIGMAFFAIYVIFPIFQSISYSFTRWDGLYDINGIWTGEWVGLHNYRLLMDDPKFWTSLWNNALWLVLFMLAVPLGLGIALFLNQTVRGIRIYKSLFFFPFVISQVVVGLIFAWAYNPEFGLLSEIWGVFFCEQKTNIVGNLTTVCSIDPPSILGEEKYATYGIIAAGLWPQIAYCMILYLTGLNNVAHDQIEAARLDGAKGWRMLRYVILPQLKPATFIAVVVTVIGALRSFDMVATMTQGGPFGSTNVLAYYMFDQAVGEGVGRYGYGSAIATVLFAIMLIYISYFLFRMYQDEKGAH